jgi:NADH:ubiquinone oxidoreductase subunit F (NADH-binding)
VALSAAGALPEDVGAVLTGGYGGAWLPGARAWDVPLTYSGVRAAGGALGPGILAVLPPHACGLAETVTIARYLAGQSAGQCGPCVFGLPDIAGALDAAVAGGPQAPAALQAVRRWTASLPGRGACRHPDGAARVISSALRVFAADLSAHAAGRPCGGWYAPRALEAS